MFAERIQILTVSFGIVTHLTFVVYLILRYNKETMSNITTDDVQYLAQLSSISVDPADVEALRQNLEDIVHYVEQLSELDTSGVEPTYQVTGLSNVWRADEVQTSSVTSEELLALATDEVDHQVRVPQVL